MFTRSRTLADADPELWNAIAGENKRQEDHIELIASENYASTAVMAAQGSQLTNKYAEGYPGKRYYGGCEFVDVAERIAIERAMKLFRRGSGQRAAPFRCTGQPGGVLCRAEAGRHDSRHEPAAWRSPDARLAGEHLRQVVQRDPLWTRPGHRTDRLRRRGTPGARTQAQADHRRRVGLFARHRLASAFAPSPTRWAHC